MIIIGIDPGTRVTGYGVIVTDNISYRALDYGCIRPPPNLKLSDRYLIIFEGLEEIIEKYKPDAVVVEQQYVHLEKGVPRNIQSVMKLGMVRGISIIAAKRKKIPVFQYAPTKAKLAVVGKGSASKAQVQAMVQHLLKLSAPPTPEDAADALSLAICHAHSSRMNHITELQELEI